MATKAVKGVDEDAWNILKSRASEEGKNMGEYINELARGLEENDAKLQWEKILANRVRHSKEEWAEIEDRIKYFRKNFGFRTFK